MSLASAPVMAFVSSPVFLTDYQIDRIGLATICVCLACGTPPAHAEQMVLASRDDAYVSHDSSSREWAIGSDDLELVIGFNSQGVLSLKRLWNPQRGRVTQIRADSEAGVTL